MKTVWGKQDAMSARDQLSDRLACADVIQEWGLARDQLRWDDLLATFAPGGAIHVSWYTGPIEGFVDRLRSRPPGGSIAKHHLFPSLIRINGARALAETSVIIRVRQVIDGVLCDLTSHGRFLDRLGCVGGDWKILARSAVYEQDRLDPVGGAGRIHELIEAAQRSGFPDAYRFMGYRITATGGQLAPTVLIDNSPETVALLRDNNIWLRAAEVRE
jgi:hypothetical protein